MRGAGHLGHDADIPVVSFRDALRILALIIAPSWTRGLFLRRATGSSLAARVKPRSIQLLQELRRSYGDGLVALPLPFARQFLVLSFEDALSILEDAPIPFTPATQAKTRALAHFEPNVSLITRGSDRTPRRDFNERILETDRRQHSLAENWKVAVARQAEVVLSDGSDVLTWDSFQQAWNRTVREIVLGPGARDDQELTDMLASERGPTGLSCH